ncbi:hypothetical protein IJT93_05005 [bacterium]|nr:hypothetical protein [bacterium]
MEIMTTLERQIQRDHSLLESDSENIDLMLTYAHNCLRRDLRFEALTVFQKVLEQRDSTQARMAVARIFYLQKLYKEAYDELEQLFASDPVNIDGHLLLHLLKEKEQVPEALALHLEFVPARTDLSDAMMRIQTERDIYRREVQEYEAIIADRGDVEPIVIYDLREAKARAEQIGVYLDILSKWEDIAIDIPGIMPSEGKSVAPDEPVEEKADEAENVIPDVSSEIKTAEEAELEDALPEVKTDKQDEAAAEAAAGDTAAPDTEEKAETDIPKSEAAEAEEPAVSDAAEAKDDVNEGAAEALEIKEVAVEDAAVIASEAAAEEKEQLSEAAGGETETAEIKALAAAESDIETKPAESPAAEAETSADSEAVEKGKTTEDIKAVEEAVVEPEPEPAPEPEVELPSQEVLDREALFVKPLENMCKINKGEIRVFILSKDLRLAASCGTFEDLNAVVKAAGACVNLAVKSEQSEDNILSWTCEYKDGSIIIADIENGYHLIVEGRSTTLGVLRQRLERCKAELSGL